jgi:hypothetical protein
MQFMMQLQCSHKRDTTITVQSGFSGYLINNTAAAIADAGYHILKP